MKHLSLLAHEAAGDAVVRALTGHRRKCSSTTRRLLDADCPSSRTWRSSTAPAASSKWHRADNLRRCGLAVPSTSASRASTRIASRARARPRRCWPRARRRSEIEAIVRALLDGRRGQRARDARRRRTRAPPLRRVAPDARGARARPAAPGSRARAGRAASSTIVSGGTSDGPVVHEAQSARSCSAPTVVVHRGRGRGRAAPARARARRPAARGLRDRRRRPGRRARLGGRRPRRRAR